MSPFHDVKTLVTNADALIYCIDMKDQQHYIPARRDIMEAAQVIEGMVHKTPVMTSRLIDEIAGKTCFFKMENFQRTGSFKIRGATFAVEGLPDETAEVGTVTHSSGNHGQALARASQQRGFPCCIVMPHTAPPEKCDAVRTYGGKIVFCEPTMASREEVTSQVIEKTGAVFIHPYDDGRIISGQATCAVELLKQVNDLDAVAAPVGGGGLLSGTALAVRYTDPSVTVIGAEPEQADDAYRSLHSGAVCRDLNPKTLADGLRGYLSDLTFSIITNHVHEIVRVTEQEIISAMKLIWQRMKVVIEPSAAVTAAAVLFRKLPVEGKRIGIILTGGNVSLSSLPWM